MRSNTHPNEGDAVKDQLSGKPHPLESVSVINQALFKWMGRVIETASSTTWKQSMNYRLPKTDSIQYNLSPTLKAVIVMGGGLFPSLLFERWVKVLFLVLSSLLLIIADHSTSYFLSRLIKSLSGKGLDKLENLVNVVAQLTSIVLLTTINGIFTSWIDFEAWRVVVGWKSRLIGCVFEKVLRYNTLNPSEHSEGKLMNYVQVDANKLEFEGEALLSLLRDIFGLIITVTLGVYFIGFPIVFLICSMVVINIFLYFTFKWEMQMNHTIMKAKDERVGFMKSILSNITYIKSRAWENLFLYRLYQKRLKEIQAIRRYGYVLALEVFLDWVNPSLAMSTIFIYKIYFSESEMDIGSFSGFMKEFNALKNIMISLPLNIALIIETYASLKRINKFLWAEEKEDYCESITELDEARKGELNITNGEFAWDNTLNSQKDDRSLDKNPAAFIPISNKDSMLKYSLID